MRRRTFVTTLAGAGLSPVAAAPASTAGIALGIDTYSLRSQRWRVPQMLDFAEAQKLDIIQASQADFESLDDVYLRQMKERADRLGIRVEPGFGCISQVSKGYNARRQGDLPKYLGECIRVAKTLGATAFKVFAGNAADRAGDTSIPQLMESTIRNIRAVRNQAVDAGVRIAVENHGDLQARELRTLIEEAGKDVAACTFDSGNPVMLAEDPVMALEILAPHIVTSHMRDSVVFEHERGAAVQWVALGDGVVDQKKLAQRFAELCPGATFQLEILTGSPPRVLPYLEADYWKAFPHARAEDLARFVALARRGRPFFGGMIVADRSGKGPEEYTAALRVQERVDLERSLEFARRTLNLGLRWRKG